MGAASVRGARGGGGIEEGVAFREIRDEETGKLVARYDPARHTLEIKSAQTGNRAKEYPLRDRRATVDRGKTDRVD